MKTIIQRVTKASVKIDGKIYSQINQGLLILLGITNTDTEKEVNWLVDKIANLRIFSDENDKMNLSVQDIKGEILVVSQFTLYADCQKGNRPSFMGAARPEQAIPLYEKFIIRLKQIGISTKTGEFGAMMKVELTNDGPVTIDLEK
ncbi:D-tyrosyl-tRNA(Tyr) deacylase [Candidatus Beckwithbacteria bacterium]|nr:D-tyrosyl-tRNA(Tyr) deacylase [Candidatus Beckwithbacteria bacterium]